MISTTLKLSEMLTAREIVVYKDYMILGGFEKLAEWGLV